MTEDNLQVLERYRIQAEFAYKQGLALGESAAKAAYDKVWNLYKWKEKGEGTANYEIYKSLAEQFYAANLRFGVPSANAAYKKIWEEYQKLKDEPGFVEWDLPPDIGYTVPDYLLS